MERGNIIIEPFTESSLSNCSYDVKLGEHYYRSQCGVTVLNPWCEEHVHRFWGMPLVAQHVRDGEQLALGLPVGSRYIVVQAGETILAHSEEFIGGRRGVTTMMKSRSSLGRACIAVCKCAGWGDVGYVNRWTMEITNSSPSSAIILPVGKRVAQIVFMACGTPSAEYHGKYQSTEDINQLKASWSPESMLPKLYLEKN
eukprot:TRINITY_DN2462_c0_g1_i1.p1 TRINITY_DN2462_c0_g1~~TRINITY_DN2462_c0_g1_i1.p1  ORF type:complete len:199 (+),score=16.86 TRINITY_DN2462_c0_g1_i1:147-743(+)